MYKIAVDIFFTIWDCYGWKQKIIPCRTLFIILKVCDKCSLLVAAACQAEKNHERRVRLKAVGERAGRWEGKGRKALLSCKS